MKVTQEYGPKERQMPFVSAAGQKSPKVLLWSILVSLFGGVFGLVALNVPTLFGIYMEPPPPILGQPYGYQTIAPCNNPYSVCPPHAQNSISIASIDFVICFGITFVIAFAILYGFRSQLSSPNKVKRNSLPIALLIMTLLIVSLAAAGSAVSGSSLTQPHWSTPSGVEVLPLDFTMFSGTASTPDSQGSAHLNLVLANFHWTALNVSFKLSVSGPNLTATNTITYQCSSNSSCQIVHSIVVPEYYALSLNTTTTALYLGNSIEKGDVYHYQLNMTGDGISIAGSLTAI